MTYTIDKSFSFCYGHRVHNQRLDTRFTESGDSCLACRHLHGHEGLIKVFLTEEVGATNLRDTGMVTDFKHLGWFKNFLDDTLDHKFIMDLKDPLFSEEFPLLCSPTGQLVLERVRVIDQGFMIPNLTYIKNHLDNQEISKTQAEQDAIFEKYEGAVFVDFVPTSENLAGWLLTVVAENMKDLTGVKVQAVEFNETPKSHCRVDV